MRRVVVLLAILFGTVAVTGFGAGNAEAKRIKLSTLGGAMVAKKALTVAKKNEDGSEASANAPTSAEDEARAAAMEHAKAKLAAEKRTETAVEVTSAVLPPNTGVVCLAGCMRAR